MYIVQAATYDAIERVCWRKGRQSVLTLISLVYLHVGRCAWASQHAGLCADVADALIT